VVGLGATDMQLHALAITVPVDRLKVNSFRLCVQSDWDDVLSAIS